MRWYEATAYESVQTGEDELHNPVCKLKEAFTFGVRYTPYVPTHDQTEGNNFDLISRTFFTRLHVKQLNGVVAIKVKDQMYSVDDLMVDGVYTAIRVRKAK